MSRVTWIIVSVLCSMLLTACGQSGPLTLPDQSPATADSQNAAENPDQASEVSPDPPADPDDEST